MREIRVLEAKRYGTYACRSDAALLDVARQMVAEDISAMVVVDNAGYLAGLISRTDMIRARLEDPDWAALPASAIMTPNVVTVMTDASLEEAAALMAQHHIHRVVVIDMRDGRPRPYAVISDADLLYHMVHGF